MSVKADRAEALEAALRANDTIEPCIESIDSDTYTDGEVYVKFDSFTHLDVAFTIAHDHGFTPNGITETPAVRFRPREDSESL